ncbi:hypothetical protein ACWGVR_31630 [Streptomyces xanthophaeus]
MSFGTWGFKSPLAHIDETVVIAKAMAAVSLCPSGFVLFLFLFLFLRR